MGNVSSASYYDNVVPSSGSEWQRLPEELAMLILDKLLETIDYVRFAAVCREWYRVAKDKYTRDTDRWYHRCRPPMLLLPPTTSRSIRTTLDRRTLCSIFQGTTYNNIHLHVPPPKLSCRDRTGYIFCCGAGHGWLAKVGVHDFYCRPLPEPEWRIQLFNPFRQATTTLYIPPFTLGPDPNLYDICPKAPRVVLSSDPALNQDNLWLLAFLAGGHELAFHKRGQDNCIRVTTGRGSQFTDAIFYRGRFYAIDNRRGRILAFDVEGEQWRILNIDRFERSSYRAYLVESTNGDLLCVNRFVKSSGYDKKVTERFKVYKLELDNPVVVILVEVTDMEDQTLFVGDTPSVSVVASNFCGCRPNSIYFTHDSMTPPIHAPHETQPDLFGQSRAVKYDVGIFRLADERIMPYNIRHFGPPFWITTPPPFDPLPASNSTGWTTVYNNRSFYLEGEELTRVRSSGSNSSEMTAIRREDERKRRPKHWLSCFSTKE